MPKTRELSRMEHVQILMLHSKGLSQVQIAKKIKCSRCAVQTTLKKHSKTKQLKIKCGRGRAENKCQRRSIVKAKMHALKNRWQTTKELLLPSRVVKEFPFLLELLVAALMNLESTPGKPEKTMALRD